jgi:SAM-dependent methyltransferase
MRVSSFRRAAARLYAQQHYFNILQCAAQWMNANRRVHDVCSGPGDVAAYLTERGGYSVTCYDRSAAFVRAARRHRYVEAVQADVLHSKFRLPKGSQVLLTNASGFFTPVQLHELLPRLQARVLIVNFIVDGDQQVRHDAFVRRRGALLTFDIGDEEPLVLRSFAYTDLERAFHGAGLEVAFEFQYTDFKTERMFVLKSRHR